MPALLKRLLDGWRALMASWEAALDDTDGEPAVVDDDSVIYVYTLPEGAYPPHLTALGYVRVPSQQHKRRLPVAARIVADNPRLTGNTGGEATHE